MDIEKILEKRFPTQGFCGDHIQVTIERINAFEEFGHHEDWSSYYKISWNKERPWKPDTSKSVKAEKLHDAIHLMEIEMDKEKEVTE
jgi:hypothetical protein